jgi:ketosteroid isomerase-like protein
MDGAELMRKVAAGLEKSDLQPLLDAIHEDIVWKSATNHPGLFRISGEHKGRMGVLNVLSNISMNFKLHHFSPREIAAHQDIVWGHIDVAMTFETGHKGDTPKAINMELAVRWRLKDGKIIEHQSYFDTASLLIQQGLLTRPSEQP